MNRERTDDSPAAFPEFRIQLGNRLREVEKHVGSRERAAKLAEVAISTLQSWVEGKAAARIEALAKLSVETGFSLDWLAFGSEPKHRDYSKFAHGDDRIVRDRAEAIYEAILNDISDFLGQRGWNMTLRRQHQLAEEFLNYVIRYDEADTRAAVLEVLIETRIPVVYEEQTAHEKIGPPSGRPGSEPPEEPSK